MSEGCDNCYAERMATRFSGPGLYAEGFAKWVHGQPHWTGKVALVETALELPLKWSKARRIFVNSMSDLFHEDISFEYISGIFKVMEDTPRHIYQVLTKRPNIMLEYSKSHQNKWPADVWAGVSVENQHWADARIPLLEKVPTAIISSDATVYRDFTLAFPRVGDVTDDGSFVFRKISIFGKPYLDLTTGTVVDPTEKTNKNE